MGKKSIIRNPLTKSNPSLLTLYGPPEVVKNLYMMYAGIHSTEDAVNASPSGFVQ